jgi:hypothetical protein
MMPMLNRGILSSFELNSQAWPVASYRHGNYLPSPPELHETSRHYSRSASGEHLAGSDRRSRQAARTVLDEFGVIVVCSGGHGGKEADGPGRSPQRTLDCAARGR